MDAHPATCPAGLHKTLTEGLKAKKVEVFAHKGKIVSEKAYVDYATRHRYIETAADWAGISEKRVRIVGDEKPPLTLEIALKVLTILGSTPGPPAGADQGSVGNAP